MHGALADGERKDWAWASLAVARDVAEGRVEQGIVCCWTGTGASIAANKVAGVRAALCPDAATATEASCEAEDRANVEHVREIGPTGRRGCSRSSARARPEAHDAVVLVFDHPSVAEQQVDVPEHLRERQVGLRDGDVAPQLLGDLVGGSRLCGDQAVDLLGAALVQAEALVDQRDVVA